MKLRCVVDALSAGALSRGSIYEADPRETETNFYGVATHYIVRGKRYGSWRFVREGEEEDPIFDPTPQPWGCPAFAARLGESGEQRAFRRFPIGQKI